MHLDGKHHYHDHDDRKSDAAFRYHPNKAAFPLFFHHSSHGVGDIPNDDSPHAVAHMDVNTEAGHEQDEADGVEGAQAQPLYTSRVEEVLTAYVL